MGWDEKYEEFFDSQLSSHLASIPCNLPLAEACDELANSAPMWFRGKNALLHCKAVLERNLE